MKATTPVLTASILLFVTGLLPVQGCALLPDPGYTAQIGEENVVILWDARDQREIFVRAVDFDTNGPNLGFIVPTPTPPTLGTVNDFLFRYLHDRLFPPIIDTNPATDSAPPTLAAPEGVEVMQTEDVGSYEASVLIAADAADLSKWLDAHGYQKPDGFDQWITPYLSAHWAITAFKFLKTNSADEVGTQAISLSFKTRYPFFPYSEPQPKVQPALNEVHRSLSIYFLGSGPALAQLVSNPGRVRFPGRVDAFVRLDSVDDVSEVENELSLTKRQLPGDLTVTHFEDDSSPRPGVADLWFADNATHR